MKRKAVALWLVCSLLLLCACADGTREMQYDGRELTEEEIAALMERSTEEEAREVPYTLLAFDEAYTASDGYVLFTKSGGVFHEDAFCRHLSRAKEVYFGTVEDAVFLGKERACTACVPQK